MVPFCSATLVNDFAQLLTSANVFEPRFKNLRFQFVFRHYRFEALAQIWTLAFLSRKWNMGEQLAFEPRRRSGIQERLTGSETKQSKAESRQKPQEPLLQTIWLKRESVAALDLIEGEATKLADIVLTKLLRPGGKGVRTLTEVNLFRE